MITFREDAVIDRITLFYLKVEVKREFSFGCWPRRYHCVVELSSNGVCGYGEICIPETEERKFDPAEYNAMYQNWHGLTFADAFRKCVEMRNTLPGKVLESVEMALIDLEGKLSGKSACECLELPSAVPTPGLYCILQHEPERVRAAAEKFLANPPLTHVKLKLFGDVDHDAKLIRTLRETVGPECFISGDVNDGYPDSLSELESVACRLAEAGLNGWEDPARMSWDHWRELQTRIQGKLNLIPDLPMRPAYESIHTARPISGMICNLHPDCMGSIVATVELGKQLKNAHLPVMIGDDSLVAAACPAWQQIACGLGAVWVEALEKPEEFGSFAECVLASSMRRNASGKYEMTPLPGFGLTLDRARLKKISCCCAEV